MREALSGDERPSVSVGYAALDPLRPSAEELVRDADRSLYEVKIESRGQQANQSQRTASPLDDT
jgi:GGDEF domain-containing protein